MVPVSWTKGVDIIVCTVCLWFLSALPLLANTMNLRAMLDARRNDEDSDANNYPVYFFFNDGLAAPVLAFSTSICMFCVQCMRVIWPRVFTGERHSAMS